jgi:hypothetical protein
MMMMHLLPGMGLLLVQPGASRLPCLVSTARLTLLEDLYPIVCKCEHVLLCRERFDHNGRTLLLMMVWYRGLSRQFVHCWVDIAHVHMGTHLIRRIQRAWRRWVERRTLAVCMASHPRLGADAPSLLVEALRVLCDEVCRSMLGRSKTF